MLVDSENRLLKIGMEVSAKFKGAYCEAKIHSVEPEFRVKLRLPDGRTLQTSHNNCQGPIKIGAQVIFQGLQATVIKMKDVSSYKVVFDDLDEKIIKRGSLCIKGQRHFDDSVTLDSLPLNDPEHFGDKVTKIDLLNQSATSSTFPDDESIFTTDDTTGPEEGSFKKDDQISEVSADSTSEKTDVSIPPPAKKSLLAESVLSLKRHHADLKESTNLDAEYAVNQAELDQADGPDERINILEIHLCYLSNQYQTLRSELSDIDKLLSSEKDKKDRKRKRKKGHSFSSLNDEISV